MAWAASVHARLLNRARQDGRPFNELLQFFAMERMLYRLSKSEHGGSFVLKGALMLQVWGDLRSRSTRDIDLLGRASAEPEALAAVIGEIVSTPVQEDGLVFDSSGITANAIRIAAHYDGVRLRIPGTLGNARINLQIDVGFGDVVTPGAEEFVYPTLLDFEAPRLLGTTPETSIAEKFEAMVTLDMANTRMKDFFDIWMLARRRAFSGAVLASAIRATFARRRTVLPTDTPLALTPAFLADATKNIQWRSYLRKTGLEDDAPGLEEAGALVGELIMAPILAGDDGFSLSWKPGGPWR